MNDTAGLERGKPVRPVINAVRVLRYLARTHGAARSAEIATALSINPSTCFNILRTLVSEGMLAFDSATKTYRHGEALFDLVDVSAFDSRQLAIARPILARLASDFEVTAALWRRIGVDRMMLVAIEHAPGPIHIDIARGERLPAFGGASGRLLVAALGIGREEARGIFRHLRWSDSLTFDAWWEEIERAREDGWAADRGHFSRGITSVAAPVFDTGRDFSLVLSAVTVTTASNERAIDEIGRGLVANANGLEANLR